MATDVKTLIEYAVIGFIRSTLHIEYVYPVIGELCMQFLSNIVTKSEYVYIDIQNGGTKYKVKVFGANIPQIDTFKFTMNDFLKQISSNHNINATKLIGTVWKPIYIVNKNKNEPILTLCHDNNNTVYNLQLNNFKTSTSSPTSIHKYDNKPPIFVYNLNELRDTNCILVLLTSRTDIIGYPLVLSIGLKTSIKATELYKKIVDLVLLFVKQNDNQIKTIEDIVNSCYVIANGSKPAIKITCYSTALASRSEEFELRQNAVDCIIDLTNVDYINIHLWDGATTNYILSTWNYLNCERDIITAPVAKYISIAYKLNVDATGKKSTVLVETFIDDKIDRRMTITEFKMYLFMKHPDLAMNYGVDDVALSIPRKAQMKDYQNNFSDPITVTIAKNECSIM